MPIQVLEASRLPVRSSCARQSMSGPCGGRAWCKRAPAVATEVVLLLALAASCQQAPIVRPRLADQAVDPTSREGSAHGFPALRSIDGELLAQGEFLQRVEGDHLRRTIHYTFGVGHWVEETSSLRQDPELVQESWTWQEVRDGIVERRFEIDFAAGTAAAEKREDGRVKRWSARLDLQPGLAFAGSAFSLALGRERERLQRGEHVELQGVGFLPKPKAATLEVSYVGLERMTMGDRTVFGEHYLLHPKIPAVLRLFVDPPDANLWLTSPQPSAFLRWEGPMAEAGDPIVRVDLLPGATSGKAEPADPDSSSSASSKLSQGTGP
jgi:hypothetical protein